MLNQIKILRPPKHSLATFGTTQLRYVLLSPIEGQPGQCRLRDGEVTAQKPRILTPDLWKERFEGFGEGTGSYSEQIEKSYGEAFRALEYTFKNDLRQTTLEHLPLPELTERSRKVLESEDKPRTALLEGPDSHWPLAVMKFIVEMSLRSFPSNVRELEEHDFFHPEKRVEQKHKREVERLFRQAQEDPQAVKPLAEFLKASGRFEDYQDRFFALLNSRQG